MPESTSMPPASRSKGGGGGQGMVAEDPSTYGKLAQLAGMGQEGEGGEGQPMGGEGGGGDISGLIKGGADQLMQAGQMSPELQPFITEALGILQKGVEQLAGGGAGGEQVGGGGAQQGSQGGGGSSKRKETLHKVTEY